MTTKIDAIRRHLPDDLASDFDAFIATAVTYQAALHKIDEAARAGELSSPNNQRAVRACETIRCIVSDAFNY